MKTRIRSMAFMRMLNPAQYSFKKSLFTIVGISALVCMISALTPMTGQGQGGTTGKEVVVINSASSPVPVTAQGTTTVAGSVSLAPGTNIGLDPANNTVKVDPASLVSETVVAFNQTATVGGGQLVILGPVDTHKFKQIRLVVVREFSSSNCGVEVVPYLHYGTGAFERTPLDEAKLNDLNDVYEVPGPSVEVSLRGLGQPNICSDLMRVVIYGRLN